MKIIAIQTLECIFVAQVITIGAIMDSSEVIGNIDSSRTTLLPLTAGSLYNPDDSCHDRAQ